MADVMMMLGTYRFSVSTAAYQQLQRSTAYKWQAQDRVGQREALQYTGPGTDTITLTGVVFPSYTGSTGQLNAMRALASTGLPQILVSGTGRVLGRWVIEKIDEQQGVFARAGVPMRQQFTMQLRKYDDGQTVSYQ